MDKLTKYRLTGAAIWLGLLIIFVPSWYSNPVDDVMLQLGMSKIEAIEDDLVLDQEILESLQDQSKTTKQQIKLPQSSKEDVLKDAAKKPLDPASSTLFETSGEQKTPLLLPEKLDKPEIAQVEPEEVKKPVKLDVPSWYVQVATLSSMARANATLNELEAKYQVTIRDFSSPTAKLYAVRIGPFFSKQEAEKSQASLPAKYKDSRIISNP